MHKFSLKDELHKCNEYSPGIVDISEILYRITLHPDHISATGEIMPVAISTKDLSCRGFSVERKSYCDPSIVKSIATKQVASVPTRDMAEIALLECDCIRAMKFDMGNNRSFLVIDEALEHDIAHASIYSAIEKPTKSMLRKLRVQLEPLLNKRMKLDELFIGL